MGSSVIIQDGISCTDAIYVGGSNYVSKDKIFWRGRSFGG